MFKRLLFAPSRSRGLFLMEKLKTKMGSLNFGTLSRLKDGIALRDLIEKNTAEFTLDTLGTEDELCGSGLDSYEFEEYGLIKDDNGTSHNDDIEHLQTKIPFNQLRQKMISITDDGKITKLILKSGSGDVISTNASSIVYLHYNCYLEEQDIPFDSSYHRSKPLRVQLGVGALYAGFELSLSSMKLHEHSQFLVEPEYAFGQMGCPPRIPPDSTILLEIELLKIVEGSDTDNTDAPLEDKNNFQEVSDRAKKYHLQGNQCFARGEVFPALDKYRKAENILLSCKMVNDEEEWACRKLLFKIYTNMCLCYNHPKLKSPERVCIAVREAFHINPEMAEKSAKLFFHLGKAQLTFQDFDKAIKNLNKAMALEPHNREIKDLMAVVREKNKKYKDQEKLTYERTFQFNKSKLNNVKPHTDFELTLRKQLAEVADGSINKLSLPVGLTLNEKELCRNISEEQGLVYEETMIAGKRSTTITK